MKRSLRRTLIAGTAAACLSLSAHAAEFVNVLTGGTSGVYYPLGVALSQIYGKAMPSAKATVQATKASAENLNLL
ncbi:MAG: C4-dicarboxylate ABC transporter, partial [Proteobacteria bacterium]|nr:C4-dicarboxylate ABC transporter [Pseudomonadota bacterium]